MMNPMIINAAMDDAELVNATLAGNRDAFGQIVTRYQSLVCSLAYSATGNLGQSEDLAQETFVTAWKQLKELREPDKLRAWLCGITRNLIYNQRRKQDREPSHTAASLEEITESHSSELLPVERIISNEEQAILWRSLEKIPETYREPLILFYRENHSVEVVAEKLELSVDTVHKRLSRGRKLLAGEVANFVEGALARTNPGKAFTLGVLAALPFGMTSAKAATIGLTIAKGGAGAKTAATFWSLGGMFAMIGASYLSLKARVDDAKSPRERRFMLQMIGIRFAVGLLLYIVLFGGYFIARKHHLTSNLLVTDIFLAIIIFLSAVSIAYAVEYTNRRQRQIQIEDGTWVAAEWNTPRKEVSVSLPADESRLKNYLRSLRFKTFLIMFAAMILMQKLWILHWQKALAMLTVWSLCLFLDFKNWQNCPRYSFRGTYSPTAIMFVAGFITLLIVNQTQYTAQFLSFSHKSKPPFSTPELIFFNAIIGLIYAAVIGFLIWKRKRTADIYS